MMDTASPEPPDEPLLAVLAALFAHPAMTSAAAAASAIHNVFDTTISLDGAQDAGVAQEVPVHRAGALEGVEEHAEEHQHDHQQDLRPQAQPEGKHENRPQHDARDRVEHLDERPEDLGQETDPAKRDAAH